MYYLLKDQSEVVRRSIRKAGSERKLAKILKVRKSAIHSYRYENRAFRNEIFNALMDFLNASKNKKSSIVLKKLPGNWRQSLGGKSCYERKVKLGTFESNLRKMNKSSRSMHKKMKAALGGKYYRLQFERFKKTGEYKYTTTGGEKVRNKLEKDVADFLFGLKKDYVYEPYIEIGGRVFFPDFLLSNKVIIECTMWKGYDKALKLKEKIRIFKKGGFKVVVVIEPKIKNFYSSISQYTVDNLNDIGEIITMPRALVSPGK